MFQAKYASSSAILSAIVKNAKAHAAVDTEWHEIGLSVMAHIEQHRDVSVVNNLVIPMYQGLGKGARHVAMTTWILTYLPVVANEEQATKATHPFKFSKKKAAMPFDFDGAKNTPWFTMKPSPAPDQVFDMRAMFISMVKKANKAAKEGLPILGDRAAMVTAAAAYGIPEAELPPISAAFFTDKDAAKEAAKQVREAALAAKED